MALPSKKIIGISILCAAVIASAFYFKDSKMLGGKGALIAVQNNNSAPPLKPKNFYQESIGGGTSSLTKSMSRDFFLNFVDLQNKGSWNIDSQSALIENLSANYAASAPQMVKVGDIAVFSDSDKAKVRIFGNAVAKTIGKYAKALETSPFDILSDADSSKISSTTFQQKLSLIAENYVALSKELSKLPSPASFAANYADIVNTYYAVGIDVNNMRFYWSDPVRGLLGITNYQKDLIHQMELLKTAADYFKTNAILFINTEEGKVWTSLTQ